MNEPLQRTRVTPAAFEGLLLLAAIFETAHLAGLFDRRAEVDGVPLAIAFTFCLPWVVMLLGLAVTRARSSVAKWVLVGLVAIGVVSAVNIGVDRWGEPAILLGAIAGILQLTAVILLFTAPGRQWTRDRR